MFRIALIEHDVDDLQDMTQFCMEYGKFELVSATAYPSRIDHLIEEYRPDAIVLDARIPGRDAYAVMQLIEARGWDIEIVLVDDRADFNSAVRAMRCGARDYYLKPVERHSFNYMLDRLETRLKAKRTPASAKRTEQAAPGQSIARTA